MHSPHNAVVTVWIVPYTQSSVQDLNLNHTPRLKYHSKNGGLFILVPYQQLKNIYINAKLFNVRVWRSYTPHKRQAPIDLSHYTFLKSNYLILKCKNKGFIHCLSTLL